MATGQLLAWPANIFVCPLCRSPLTWLPELVSCSACDARYAISDGIPLLVAKPDSHKQQQARFFDEVDAEYEIERPIGTPPLHHWLLDEKFRRSVSAIGPLLPGASALNVCGGSGMDAGFLARLGARVLVVDISVGAAQRALERARRHGLELSALVADAERLPLRDRSVDVAFVHDGLHHLSDPLTALCEMARIAKRAVSVNEPAQAAVTRVAIHAGISSVQEEAGNYIWRLDVNEVASMLEQCGFDVLEASRYAMFYRHNPGSVTAWLSHEPLFFAARTALLVFNRLAGRIGNKMTVQAVRREDSA
jgi:ubiquinone/menaquinone biosynthesis C-methylase UbiE